MRVVAGLLGLLAACDRVFGVHPPEILGPFTEPVLIEALASEDSTDQDATLTADLREIIFVSNRPGGLGLEDLWTSTRDGADGVFAPPVAMAAPLSSARHDQHPHLTPDGLVLYFSSDRDGEWEIYRAERSTRDSAWSMPVVVTGIAAAGSVDQMGSTAFDQRRLAISSGRDAGDARRDLYLFTRERVDAPWSGPVRVTNTTTPESSPFLAAAGTVIYFTRQDDLYRGRLEVTDAGARLVDEALVEELSTATFAEADPWLLDDESLMVFSTTRRGKHDLYMAIRER